MVDDNSTRAAGLSWPARQLADELAKADALRSNTYLNLDRPPMPLSDRPLPKGSRWPLLTTVAQHGYDPHRIFGNQRAKKNENGEAHYDLLARHCARDLPRRWLLLSGRRTSSSWHIDPLNTSAWNTLLLGTKRWALLPPTASWPVSKGVGGGGGNTTLGNSIGYFNSSNPFVREMGWWGLTAPWRLDTSPTMSEYFAALDDKENDLPAGWSVPLQCEQRMGETIFVPSGWWHGVLNGDHGPTAAVTENFAAFGNLAEVKQELAKRPQRPGSAAAACLQQLHEVETGRDETASKRHQENETNGRVWDYDNLVAEASIDRLFSSRAGSSVLHLLLFLGHDDATAIETAASAVSSRMPEIFVVVVRPAPSRWKRGKDGAADGNGHWTEWPSEWPDAAFELDPATPRPAARATIVGGHSGSSAAFMLKHAPSSSLAEFLQHAGKEDTSNLTSALVEWMESIKTGKKRAVLGKCRSSQSTGGL